MGTSYPTALDTTTTLPAIGANDPENTAGKEHDVQHSTLNAAVLALEAKAGADASTDPTSHEYRITLAEIAGINEQTGTAYTLAASDLSQALRCTNAAKVTVTIPASTTTAFPVCATIPVFQGGAGAVELTAATGVTLESPSGAQTSGIGDFRTAFQRATDVWVIA